MSKPAPVQLMSNPVESPNSAVPLLAETADIQKLCADPDRVPTEKVRQLLVSLSQLSPAQHQMLSQLCFNSGDARSALEFVGKIYAIRIGMIVYRSSFGSMEVYGAIFELLNTLRTVNDNFKKHCRWSTIKLENILRDYTDQVLPHAVAGGLPGALYDNTLSPLHHANAIRGYLSPEFQTALKTAHPDDRVMVQEQLESHIDCLRNRFQGFAAAGEAVQSEIKKIFQGMSIPVSWQSPFSLPETIEMTTKQAS